MKTIAITIDEPTLRRLDELVVSGNDCRRNRSQIIRQAVQDYVARLERINEEEREKEIFGRHRKRLERQVAELVKEQAKL
jgi:metal-responsive CopG/Arc/MetJ family transcriptional regulator